MLPPFIPLINTILDKIFPNSDKANEAKVKVLELSQRGELADIDARLKIMLAQADINKAEAASSNRYASSWRPTIGYICAVGIAYNFIIYPFLVWGAAIYAPYMEVPKLANDNLMELVVGMLGLAGFRTFEKVKTVK